MNGENEVTTVGKLRAITSQARAVDAVEVWVYLPGHRGPVKCYVGGWSLKPPIHNEDETPPASKLDNILNLYVRPIPEPDRPDEPESNPQPVETTTAIHGAQPIPDFNPEPYQAPPGVFDGTYPESDKGRAGWKPPCPPGTDNAP